ncbi:DUF2087 domain-containing protein [Micromonospora humida]|uniref:DUF2087 domain-containing protein n=1 Tax=Micromonospora humida TaxID=2809018 RepID=A0ABS2IS91_9ACTN|nr:DUF2087 domain-containing protein [Micromonospora humida]MBM7077195.1 DUF2087 domain-containing protein [Micromonospora humida]
MTPEELALLLADSAVRQVFAAVTLGAATSTEILAATGLTGQQAAPAIGQLLRAGLLRMDGPGRLALVGETLAGAAATAARRQEERAVADQPDPGLRGFVRGNVVVRLPEEDDARRTVLRHVAGQSFAPDERYDERVVTDRLRPWCTEGVLDAVTLRRLLVDAGLLNRSAGWYVLVVSEEEPVTR